MCRIQCTLHSFQQVLEVLTEQGETFALKKVNFDDSDSDEVLSMYRNEIMFLEKMRGNKHIIRLHDWYVSILYDSMTGMLCTEISPIHSVFWGLVPPSKIAKFCDERW